MEKWIFGSVIAILTAAMTQSIGLAALSVEQQDYTFKMGITRNITASTFVIEEFADTTPLRAPSPTPVSEKNKRILSLRKRETQRIEVARAIIQPVLFGRADSALAVETKRKILAALAKKVDTNTPLRVTGYTCDLGTQQFNDALALRRAKAVAELLRSHGYNVAAVIGKGKQNYVSHDPDKRYLNRRVEITGLLRPAAPNGK